MQKTILLAGGAGYIGSHTAVELIKAGYKLVVADNLCNSSEEGVRRVEKITGAKIPLVKTDIRDSERLDEIFNEYNIRGAVHFAGLKAVGESVEKPLLYYRNNLDAMLSLLEIMSKQGGGTLIFSSSATVYDTTFAPTYRGRYAAQACKPLRPDKIYVRADHQGCLRGR